MSTYDPLISSSGLSNDLPAFFNENFRTNNFLITSSRKTADFTAWADDSTGAVRDIYVIDASGGDVDVTLPEIATSDGVGGRGVWLVAEAGVPGNTISVAPSGTDTISGSGSWSDLNAAGDAVFIWPDAQASPKNWVILSFYDSTGGGGGGGVSPLTLTRTSVSAASYSVAAGVDVVEVDASSNNVTINLPAVASSDGRQIVVNRRDNSSFVVTIDPNSTETINGDATLELVAQYESVTLIGGSSEWMIV